MMNFSLRPYLVLPKLILQPTWGGTYIAETKRWSGKPELTGKKIGQSYELYDKSNLSVADTSGDEIFTGEIADSRSVKEQTAPPNAFSLADYISHDPDAALGVAQVSTHGPSMHLLLKFTQALGNSFQLHVPDGTEHPRWKPKPESWYYFEPGLITCGVKLDASWNDYQRAVTELDAGIQAIAAHVRDASLAYEEATQNINALMERYDPWQYVNLERVEAGTLLDLSPCGIHHSWEEDLATIPLGNVLYEIQLNVMDDVSTIRSFDKGKMSKDGKLRALQIEDYFALADRSPEANTPKTHMRSARTVHRTDVFTHDRILETDYYSMDRITIAGKGDEYVENIETFRHVFVKSGGVEIHGGDHAVTATAGHSVFVPAGCGRYAIRAAEPNAEVLVSY